VVVCWW